MKTRVKILRVERDWTQARLAEELDVSRQTVNAIETGKYDPSLPLAFRIAKIFAQPIEAMFFPDGVDDTKARRRDRAQLSSAGSIR